MIYTFYSYKGGVGRTMALANVAELFYQAGLKVLMVDWDLEAPGLERFFFQDNAEEILDRPGIIDMLLAYKQRMSQISPARQGIEEFSPFQDPSQFMVELSPRANRKGQLWLLPAGQRSDEHFDKYANAVLTFDWQDFYQNWEGELYFEWLRQRFEEIADVILIDSRTGVTEMGGVCTYQLADVIVMFCAANRQNLEGIYKMARDFRRPEVQVMRRERPLEVLVIPARLEQAEGNQLNQFKEDFLNRSFAFAPSVPVLREHPSALWSLGIPYIPYYAYNEEIAVRERDKAIAASLVEAFDKLARTLARLAPPESPLKRAFGSDSAYDSAVSRNVGGGFTYDAFISYSQSDSNWVWDWLVPRLKDAGLNICTDREFVIGMPIVENLERAIADSRHVLLVLSPAWLNDQWPSMQMLFNQTDPSSVLLRLLPILLQACELPHPIRSLAHADLTNLAGWEITYNKLLDTLRGERRSPAIEQSMRGRPIISPLSIATPREERQEVGQGLIPDQLLSNIKRGDCVLFLGADLPLDYSGAPPSYPELAQTLALKYGLPPDRAWPETAATYLAKFGRNSLISFLMEQLTATSVRPGHIHRAIAQAGFRAIVTSWYDERLEEALHEAGYLVHRVVADYDLPYSPGGERDVTVVHLLGCISNPESLVLTRREHVLVTSELTQKLRSIISFAALRPSLFVGHNPTDTLLTALYAKATENIVEHMRRAYIIWPQPSEEARAYWSGTNVEFLDYAPLPFLEALAKQIARSESLISSTSIHVRKPPYKFLDYFTSDDADIFCGREAEIQLVFRLALSRTMLTLFGASGSGKTSLLLAGVLPRFEHEGYKTIYLRTFDDPLSLLRHAILAETEREDKSTSGLRSLLRTCLDPNDRLVIVFDQFEEFFLRLSSTSRRIFFHELAAILAQPEREVRVILSLREDYLAHLDEARVEFPHILESSFRLTALDRTNAYVAITEPATRAGMIVEQALVDALVGGAGRGSGDLLEADGRVPPAALQIVLDRLYMQALPHNYDQNGPPSLDLKLTLTQYLELGGASAILANYADESLYKLQDFLPGTTTDLGRAILKAMVTSQATKAALTQAEILDMLEEMDLIQSSNPWDVEAVEKTRLGLEHARLLRGFEQAGVALYELSSQYLAARIATWIGQEEMQVKLVRELLRREIDNWRYTGLLIPIEALKIIHEQRKELRRLTKDELELIFRSALAHGCDADYWFDRAREGGVVVDDIALEGLRSQNFRVRVAAVNALSQLGEQFTEPIVAMLADLYPQVRAAAINALERMLPDGVWRRHLKYECYVPTGAFIMGDDQDEEEEKPVHEVYLAAFYISKYPVTNAEYKQYIDDLGRAFEVPVGKADHPVVGISWYDARDYAAWAGMRLLTEAEWEKAASWQGSEKGQAGAWDLGNEGEYKSKYPWGDAIDVSKCNTCESNTEDTTPVGKYSPQGDSFYGCSDMAGNVQEWTSSLYRPYPYKIDDGREDMSSSQPRVVRSGSFQDSADHARSVHRCQDDPSVRSGDLGLRIGKSAAASI